MWKKILDLWEIAVDFLYSLVLSLAEMIKDIFFGFFDSLLSIVVMSLEGLGSLFSALNVTQYITILPPETLNLMALCGIDIATSMIVTSIIIRLTMQLIPFVRLGS